MRATNNEKRTLGPVTALTNFAASTILDPVQHATRMGKKGKSRRAADNDDFEIAVQSLEIDTPVPPPQQQADGESSELDELLERALVLGLLSEAGFDELTDALADGTRSEPEVRDDWKVRLQQWEAEQDKEGGAPPAVSATAAGAWRVRNALRVLGSLDELEKLTAAVGTGGLVVVQYTAKWCGQCRKIGPFFSAALPAEFPHLRFASIDVDACAEAAGRAGAEKLPLFELLIGGNRVDTLVGAQQTALRRLVAKHAPLPPHPAEGDGDSEGQCEGVDEGGDDSGGDSGCKGGGEGESEAQKRLNRLVPIGSAAQLDELYEEAAAAAAAGDGSGLVVVAYHLRSDAGCKKVAAVYERKLPAEFADVHFASVDIAALPALAARAGMEPPEALEEHDDNKPSISQLGRKAKSHKGGGGQELPLFELLRGGKRFDTVSGPQATALRDKVIKHRAAAEEDSGTAKKKKKGKQAKSERQACGYTGGR